MVLFLHTLSAPGPGVCTLTEVKYIMPANSSTAEILTELPKYGRAIITHVKKDKANCWCDYHKDYQNTVGAAEAAADKYTELIRHCRDTHLALALAAPERTEQKLSADEAKDITEFFTDVATAVAEWERTLRAAACDELKEETLSLATDVTELALSPAALGDAGTPGLLKALKEVLVHCNDEPLLTRVCDVSLRLQVQDATGRLKELIDAICSGPSVGTLTALSDFLEGKPCDSFRETAEDALVVQQVVPKMLSWAAALPADNASHITESFVVCWKIFNVITDLHPDETHLETTFRKLADMADKQKQLVESVTHGTFVEATQLREAVNKD